MGASTDWGGGRGRGEGDVWQALLTFVCGMVFLLNLKSFDSTGLRRLENINTVLISESDLIKKTHFGWLGF